jgi:cobalt-zinc-cadmium efflux system protein
MDHGHHHAHSHTKEVDGNRRAFIIGITLNLAFVFAEVIAGIIYNSIALLTDAGHNLSDVATLALSLVAFWMSNKKSTPRFTYGFKKTTVLAALANAMILLIAIGVLGVESVSRLFHPQPLRGDVIAWIAALGILINFTSAFLFYRQRRKELNAKSAYLHLLADGLVSFGVVVAGIIISYTNLYWLDPALGIVIMTVILFSTWRLLKDSFQMSMDAVPSGIELSNVKKIILSVEHVQQVRHVHVWALSTTQNALTAHVVIDRNLDFDEKLNVIDKIKHELLHLGIQHSTIELDKLS